MAIHIDEIRTLKGNEEIREQITVTIALEEYRCLVEENARLMCANERLHEKCRILEERMACER